MTTSVTLPDLPDPLDPAGPYSVVMVCTGNICRSPMAQMVLLDRLLAATLPSAGVEGAGVRRSLSETTTLPSAGVGGAGAGGVVVSSAGVSSEESGNPIDQRARRVLAAHGYGQGQDAAARAVATAMSTHVAHRITDAELEGADLLLAMTHSHYARLERRLRHLGLDPARVRMFREFDPRLAGSALMSGRAAGPRALDVADPWYGTTTDFEDTLELVERVCDAVLPLLQARP